MNNTERTVTGMQHENGMNGLPPFDRDEWIQQKNAEREQCFEMIDQAAELMKTDGERLRTYLDLQSRFPRYTVSNVLLLSVQKPDARRIHDFKGWRDIGVHIKRGETAILLLEAGNRYTREDGSTGVYYNTKRVFDTSQTTALGVRDRPSERDPGMLVRNLDLLSPCRVREDDGTNLGGNLYVRYDLDERTIYIAQDAEGPEAFREATRELARATMDYLNLNPDTGSDAGMFHAECVSYMLCRRYGVDVRGYSFTALPEAYEKMDVRAFRDELGNMRRIANIITSDLDRLIVQERDAACLGEAR